jgi:hypothetical protein
MADGSSTTQAGKIVLDKKINLVFPITHGDKLLYVHAMPIRRETFEQYFLVISKTFAAIYKDNLQLFAGARVCALMMREVAKDTLRSDGRTWWEGSDGVEAGLLGEIRRLANVVCTDDVGNWITMPYDDAVRHRILDEDDIQEVEGTLAFFTVNYAIHKREVGRAILTSSGELWGWQIISSDLQEFKTSLTTSTREELTGETGTALSIPS